MHRCFAAIFVMVICASSSPAQQLGDVPCPVPSRWYGTIDFLWWYLRQDDAPPLVTSGGTGIVGDPGVAVLYGGTLCTRHDRFIGVRPTMGVWFNDQHTTGLELSAFLLERDSSLFQIEYSTDPLFRPYTRADGQGGAEQVAGLTPAGILREGSINIYGRKEFFGEDVRGLVLLADSGTLSCHGIAGAKLLQFRNRFNITATGYDLPDRTILYGVQDNFFTHDRFYGGQLGLRTEWQDGAWSAQLTLACGLGANEQQLTTYGTRQTQTPLFLDRRPVGLLVQRTNTIDESRWVFDAIPEVMLNLAWSPTDWFRVQVGYSLLLWLNALRASDQIDAVNTDQILGDDFAGPRRPLIPWKESVFWAQGVNVGLELRW